MAPTPLPEPSETVDLDGDVIALETPIQDDHPDHPFVRTAQVQEHHKTDIYGVSFNHYTPVNKPPIFATVGANYANLYECSTVNNKKTLKLRISFKDSTKKEVFYSCCWVLDAATGIQMLCAAGEMGVIRVIDIAQARLHKDLNSCGGHVINEIRRHPFLEGIVASASKDQTVRVWHISHGYQLIVLGGLKGHKDQILSLDFSSCGLYIVTGSMDHSVKLWRLDGEAKNTLQVYLGKEPSQGISRKSGRDKKKDVTKKKQEEWERMITNKVHEGLTPDRSTDGSISKSYAKTAKVQFACAKTKELHTNYVDCVRIVGDFIVSKSSENVIHVFKFGKFDEGVAGENHAFMIETRISPMFEMHIPHSSQWFIKFDLDPKGRKWIACGNELGEVSFWKTADIQKECDYKLSAFSEPATVRQVVFEPFGKILIAVGDNGLIARIDRWVNTDASVDNIPVKMGKTV